MRVTSLLIDHVLLGSLFLTLVEHTHAIQVDRILAPEIGVLSHLYQYLCD